ncbi:helix-turn-helix domain-containing protein [Fundidesulfovibrio putealis]|uniref:helix-turn-helix domain-containing protein n=1 Tax=Fundidesulfovibrio putealis TaxID=270496 RepID=UPI00041AB55F|nr:helix-turn-helix transcriptional regulator [Fundidesulfovibrio putealis]
MITSRVKETMESQGVTMRELISRTGLSMQTVNRARGAMISRCALETLAVIAGALKVKTKDLYEEVGPEGQA